MTSRECVRSATGELIGNIVSGDTITTGDVPWIVRQSRAGAALLLHYQIRAGIAGLPPSEYNDQTVCGA
jgi:hypothetical protein